jgi:DNA-binding SARP family transcriptional activator
MSHAVAASAGGAPDLRADDGPLRLQILGPLRAWRGDVELDLGPRQQAALLAMLLARAGRPISRDGLIELIWGDESPQSAVNVIYKYVGVLRRLLEPDLPARVSGSHLRRSGDGYLFDARGSELDVITFQRHADGARQALGEQRDQVALERFVDALTLWHGAAGEGVGVGLLAAPAFVTLNGQFFTACVAASELAVRLGQPERVLPALQLASSMAPLDEVVHAAWVTALGAAGRRAEALATMQAMRERLANELGIDPGPALRAAQQQVLADAPAPVASEPRAVNASHSGLIGRVAELEGLDRAVRAAFTGGTAVVVVDGEPGVGKTRLLREFTARAERAGAVTVWGRCLEGDGTPPLWPWMKVVGALLDSRPFDDQAHRRASELSRLFEPSDDEKAPPVPPDSGTRFRLFEQVVELVGMATTRQPVVVVIDDLQWADIASLQLFGHLAVQLPNRAVMVGALRDRAPTPGTELSQQLAAASRMLGYRRTHLNPLRRAEVAELVRREIGNDPGVDAVRGIYARTAGNPFFVRELARLLVGRGAGAMASLHGPEVPSTVRDVVRSRTAGLGDEARRLLQLAALVGRETGVALLAHATDTDIATCLDRLEPLAALGVIESTPGDPFSFRFPHDLVREAVVENVSARQATELHLRIADALEAGAVGEESVTERLAFHLSAAGPVADPSRTAIALIRAGDRAARKSAFEAAERNLQSAIELARTAGSATLELAAVAPLVDVFWKQGRLFESYTDLLARAESLAHGLGEDIQAADFLYMRVVASLTHHHAGTKVLMRRLIDHGETSADPTTRAHARYLQARYDYERGDTAAALRHMNEHDWTGLRGTRWRPNLMGDQQAPLFQALLTAIHGDVPTAKELLRAAEESAGNDAYTLTLWAYSAAVTSEWIGDPVWGLAIAARWRTADPHHCFVNIDPPMRVFQCWTLALTTDDANAAAAAAVEAEQIVATTMLDPPRFHVTRDYALVAEMFLAAGIPHKAAAALDQADRLADLHDEPFTECLRLLMRARALHAGGESADIVRAVASRARSVSLEGGAHVIARRAEELIVRISSSADG